MKANLGTLPEEVRNFVKALVENAKQVEDWAKPDMSEGRCFADTIAYVSRRDDGSVEVSDNYERFFDTIYIYQDGEWKTRRLYSEQEPKNYTYEQCMADASIMFTG